MHVYSALFTNFLLDMLSEEDTKLNFELPLISVDQSSFLWSLDWHFRRCIKSWGCIMYCLSCGSTKQAELTAEMMIHFRGLAHPNNPGVLLFPEIRVCLGCGLSQFTVPETELASITRVTLENKSYPLKESADDVAQSRRIA